MADITETCEECGKKFLIIEQEQEFLQKKGLPLPKICPTDRQKARLSQRGERNLYKTNCQNCGASMITTYDPTKVTNKILCKKCYLEYFEKTDLMQK
jgi:hypothetical protein